MHYVSRIHKFFSKELMIKINNICHDVLISDNNTKVNKITELLHEYDLPFSELGPGTNRFAIMIDGYVFKIAMDKDGVRDNLAEFSMAMELQPFVTKVYECNGLICVAEYVTVISKEEFQRSKEELKQILVHLSDGYLLGDVGTISKNFMNWGYRPDGTLVVLDFAYIYRVVGDEMLCSNILDDNNQCGAMLEYDDNYNNLICPRCRHKYTFHEIRRRISKSYEEKELNAIKQIAVKMTSESLNTRDNTQKREISNTDKGDTTMKNKNLYDDDFITEEEAIDSYQEAMMDMLRDSIYNAGGVPKDILNGTSGNVTNAKFGYFETADDLADDDDDDEGYTNIGDFLNDLAQHDKDDDDDWCEDPEDKDYDEEDVEEYPAEETDESPVSPPAYIPAEPVTETIEATVEEEVDECSVNITDTEETDAISETVEDVSDEDAEEIREEIFEDASENMSDAAGPTVMEYDDPEEIKDDDLLDISSSTPAVEQTSETPRFENNDVLVISNASESTIAQMRNELMANIEVGSSVDDDDEEEETEYEDMYEENFRMEQRYKNAHRNKRDKGDY